MDLSKQILEKRVALDEMRADKQFLRELEVLEQYAGEDKVMHFSEVVEELREKMKNAPDSKVFSKLPTLDGMLDGFRPGQLVVLSAPTGNGKTAWLQSLTRSFVDQKVPCLWFSYEVPALELAERFGADVPAFELPRKNVSSSFEWLTTRSMEGIAKFGTRVIFIDHLHYLLDMKSLAGMNASLVIGGLMRELKKFAIKTETTIFLVSHMAKTKIEAIPSLADLRDSSFVAQEADIVMLMWRVKKLDDKKLGEKTPQGFTYTNESCLIVDKNRWNGKLGYVQMMFDKGRFTEIINHEELPAWDAI